MKSNLKTKLNSLLLVLYLLFSTIFLNACNPINDVKADPLPSAEPEEIIPDTVIETRDSALTYVKKNHLPGAPSADLQWTGRNATIPGVLGGTHFEFTSGDWLMTVSFPIVAPDNVIYTVILQNNTTGFYWEGKLDAYGAVIDPTPEPAIENPIRRDGYYENESFNVSFTYPGEWDLSEISIDPLEVEGALSSHVVELCSDAYKVRIHMKNKDDLTVIGGGLAAGEILKDGTVVVLGQTIDRNKLVYENSTKSVWYGFQDGDTYFYIRIEALDQSDYNKIDISNAIISDVEDVLKSFAPVGEVTSVEVKTSMPSETPVGIIVDGWVGMIISTPDLPQIDDYFQMVNQNGDRYGILSQDPEIQEQLVSYRDSEIMIKIWGTLYEGRVDAFNTQIEVTKIEELGDIQVETSPVEDWIGTIVSNPPEAQFDDYFQLMDQEGSRYGIESLDEAIHQQLIDLRDSGKTIHVWGTLYENVPDAYGYQIEVTKIEVEG